MRRVVVEVYGPELESTLARSPTFRDLRSLEVIQILRYDRREFAGICRIQPRDPNSSFLEVFRKDPSTSELQVLHRDPDGSMIVLLKRNPVRGTTRPRLLFGGEVTGEGAGYLLGPLGYRDGKLRFSFVGNQRQIRNILEKAGFSGYRHRIVSLSEAQFGTSPLDTLTRRQRAVLETAYELGWYEVPRRVTATKVARRLGIRAGTVVEHLRKAERRLLVELIGARSVEPAT
jgi:DNA-binding CsgD family transcriptional regulator